MTKRKSTKRALLLSALSIVMCVAMLVGSTYAWFTDEVTSANNIIKSGTLKINMQWAKGTDVPETAVWTDASAGPIFNNDLWEPGYTEARHIKIVNAGTLALAWNLAIVPNGEVSALGDVIDVYVADEATQVADRNDLTALEYKGTLTEWISTGIVSGKLEKGETYSMTIVLKMSEEAGNEYQGLSIGSDFAVKLIATQLTSESDSFDKYYDGAAKWLGYVDTSWYNDTDKEFTIGSGEELAGLAQLVNTGVDSFEGKTVKLISNIDLNNFEWTPIGDADADVFVGFKGTFDGQNYAINNLKIDSTSWGKGLFGYMDSSTNATVKNVKINNADITASDCAGIIVGYATLGTFENIHVVGNVSVVGTSAGPQAGHVGGIAGCGYFASFNNCSVIANAGSKITSADAFVGGIVGYQCDNTKAITDCKVANLTITGKQAVGGIAGIIKTGANFAFTNNSVTDVVLNMTRVDANPSIGALVGNYSGTAETTLTGTVTNVTLNANHIAYSAYNNLYGSNYSGETTPNFDVTGVTVNGITENLAIFKAVNTVEDLKTALKDGVEVIDATGVVVEGTTMLNYGATIIGATFKNENGIAVRETISGTFKNCVFEGSEALRWCYSEAGDTVVFENCVIKTDFRGVHFDGMEGDVIFKNCEINGFNAIGGDATVTFEGCTFGNDASSYNGLNMYSNINIIDCTFNFESGKTNFIDMEGTGKTLTIENCKAYLDGVETDIANFVGGSKLAQNTVIYK